MKFSKILVVCVGNICRSPLAEKLFEKELGVDFSVKSAGLNAVVDAPMHEISADILRSLGIDDVSHTASQICPEDVSSVDIIFVMEQRHIEIITSKFPSARGKIFLLGHWDGKKDIPDPYKKSREYFEICSELIIAGVEQWKSKLL